ncbi:MAG: superoxide dismutase family protein [Sulfuritalea sp.]|jgi:Cu-Zn family superoxide dismutase|nr:superoxide dismutase family protein [Sulfuritalea sp.]
MKPHSAFWPAIRIACFVSAASLLNACASMEATGPKAEATLEPRSGSTVTGTISFQTSGQKIRIEARVAGLTPGAHGFHVHEAGDCSAPDASSAKGHFNPAGRPHGHHGSAERHAGDMPNLVADSSGKATLSAEVDMLSLTEGPGGILRRSVVIHADPDDYKSQPAGNSGKRVACGVIRSI